MGILARSKNFAPIPDYRSVATFRIIGVRLSGKSGLAESIATRYLQNGSTIFDVYQSNDNESLAWLESPFADRVVLVRGDETELRCPYKSVPISQLDPRTVPNGRIYIVCKNFFGTEELYYAALERLTSLFKKRDKWDRPHAIIIREAQEWVAGRIKSGRPKGAKDAAEEFVTLHNSLFHCGYAVIIDSQRNVGVSKDIRELTTWFCVKAVGNMEIPRDIEFTMRSIAPEVIRYLPKHLFIIVGEAGLLGVGWFLLPPWHIVRGSSIIDRLGIKVSVDEGKTELEMNRLMEESRTRRWRSASTGDRLHAIIVKEHLGENGTVDKPLGKPLRTIALEFGISRGVVSDQWAAHKIGACGCVKN
jgi:hypothetical protein